MPNFADKALEFIKSTQAKLEEIKKDFLKYSPKSKEKNVVLILDINNPPLPIWRFDA